MGARSALVLGLVLFAGCSNGGGPEAPPQQNPPVNNNPPPAQLTGPPGARSFKSGPIQITADGRWVWTANTDNDSVSRLDTSNDSVDEFALPGDASPRTLSVTEDGSEVWVACHDTDCVHVLRGSDGALAATIDLPWGSGPVGVALAPDQKMALVTLHRRGAIAEIDVATRTVSKLLEPVWRTPLAVAWEGTTAWITHVLVEGGEHPFLTRIDCAGPQAMVAGNVRVGATDPRSSSKLAAPTNIAEGGYLTFRGHIAQRPGRNEMWIPTQYNNIHEDIFTPDSTVQATVRRLKTDTFALPNNTNEKVILSAVHAHEPTGGNAFVGPGWNAQVAGPIDIGFAADGTLACVVCELSDDVVILPTDATNVRPAGAPPLPEISVGNRPTGIALSPVEGAAYVLNRHSRDVSVIDVGGAKELRRIPVSSGPTDPQFQRGAILFHTSADPRLSSNGKVACASCHLDAELDGRSWSFHRLEGRSGNRPTLTLRGLGRHFGPRDPVTGFGQLHRSGDRDEVQDFEHTIRGESMRGTGLINGPVNPALGAPNAGRSADLDALAAYVLALDPLMRSPFRRADGTLTERAVRGAQLFLAAACDTCHVPETGFVDFRFHDVGSNRPGGEEELNQGSRAPYQWHVNTKTLIGLFATPPYNGVATWADDMDRVLEDIAGRDEHGDIGGLTGQQRADLATFLLSVDGNMTAAEVRNARDTTAPTIVRAEPASLTQLDVWFSEPVSEASAETPGNWTVAGTSVAGAVWDSQNGDRVTLTVQLAKNSNYTVTVGAVKDTAGNPATGALNFAVGDTLTVTFGASGYENVTIDVHDAGPVGPGLSTWSHDAPWLFNNGGTVNKGFVRFEWRDALAALGANEAADIVSASFAMDVEIGHRHPVEIRRCLQAWSDPATGGDWNKNPVGGPTWRDHSHPNGRWNQSGARRRTAGIEGDAAADYDGTQDTAFTADTTATIDSITEPVVFDGTRVTEAFRFWFDNPTKDYGYMLELAANAPSTGLKFWSHEHGLGRHGPVLTVTYKLP